MERFTCPKCRGERRVKDSEIVDMISFDGKRILTRTYPKTRMCLVCNGTGVVDWLTNITQREVPF